MLKRILPMAVLTIAAGLVAAPRAEAARFYVGGDLGWTFLIGQDEFDDDLVYGGALGIDFDGPAIEFTAKYASFDGNEVDLPLVGRVGGDLDVLSLGLSARYNFDLSALRIYILLGGGYHIVDFDTFDSIDQAQVLIDNDQNQWGLIAGGGVEIKLGDHITVGPDLRYNLILADDFDSTDAIKDTDLSDYPDFLQITGRVNIYF